MGERRIGTGHYISVACGLEEVEGDIDDVLKYILKSADAEKVLMYLAIAILEEFPGRHRQVVIVR